MKIKKERVERIRSLLLKEVSLYIQYKMGIIDFQITKVLLSSDLKQAKFLFVNIYEENNRLNNKLSELENFLNRNSKKIRNDLFRKLGLRYVPEFVFEYDKFTFEYDIGGKEV
ncbi:MAG: ribosome-binding factor A [bacterium]